MEIARKAIERSPALNPVSEIEWPQKKQREWDLKVFTAAIFVAFIFIIHPSCFAFFAFSRGNFGFPG